METAAPAVTGSNERQNNYPPFVCIRNCKPCFYQNIDEEIDTNHRSLVRWAHRTFIASGIYYIIQFVAVLVSWMVTVNIIGGILMSLFSFGEILILVPLQYVFWFRPIYRAFSSETKKLNFFMFFGSAGITILWLGIQAFGFPGYTPGFINGLQYIQSGSSTNIFIGALSLFCGVYAAGLVVLNLLLFLKIYRIYKSAGIDVQQQSAGDDTVPTLK